MSSNFDNALPKRTSCSETDVFANLRTLIPETGDCFQSEIHRKFNNKSQFWLRFNKT